MRNCIQSNQTTDLPHFVITYVEISTGSYASPKRVHQITSPAAGGGAGGGIGILSGQSDDSVLTLRLLMSGRDTGSVIGKGGSFIKTVRERSSARVNISSDSFSTERMVTITGGINAINTAVMMMASRLENVSAERNRCKAACLHMTDLCVGQ